MATPTQVQREDLERLELARMHRRMEAALLETGTALFEAACDGDLAEVNRLLDMGEDVNEGSFRYLKETPLHIASKLGHLAVVERLLESPDIEVNKPDYNGATSLYAAAAYGRNEVLRRLLAFPGINIEHKARNGKTALDVALHPGTVHLLEEAHRSLNQTRNSAQNMGRLRGTLSNVRSIASRLPKELKSRVGSYLSGYNGTLIEQKRQLRINGASEELFAAPPAPAAAAAGAAGGAGGAGGPAGGEARKSGGRRKRRYTRRCRK